MRRASQAQPNTGKAVNMLSQLRPSHAIVVALDNQRGKYESVGHGGNEVLRGEIQ